MNPQFPQFLSYLMKLEPPFRVEFHTNATLITEELAHELTGVRGSLSIAVSLDGGTEASHDANRGVGSFRRSLTGLRRLLKARGTRAFPKINIHQLDLRENPAFFDAGFMDLTKQVDEWQIKKPILPSGDRTTFKESGVTPGGSPLIKDWEIAKPPVTRPLGACFWAGNALCIAPSGDVAVCLLSSTKDGVLGNILADGVDTIMKRSRSFRESLENASRSNLAHCRECLMEEGSVDRQFSEWSRVATSQGAEDPNLLKFINAGWKIGQEAPRARQLPE